METSTGIIPPITAPSDPSELPAEIFEALAALVDLREVNNLKPYKLRLWLRHERRADTPGWSNLTQDVSRLLIFEHGANKSLKRYEATNIVFANLAVASLAGTSAGMVWPMGHVAGRLLARPVNWVIKGLAKQGLVEITKGYKVQSTGETLPTWIRPTQAFFEALQRYEADPWDVHWSEPGRIILREKDPDEPNPVDIPFRRTRAVIDMEKRLNTINEMSVSAQVRLNLPKGEAYPHSRMKKGYADITLDVTKMAYNRIFNRRSFECGGRFYGHWVQSLPKAYRRNYLTINGHRAIEADYNAMHITMLYAELPGAVMPHGDPYTLPSFEGLSEVERKRKRSLCKTVALMSLNAKSRKDALSATALKCKKQGVRVTHAELKELLAGFEKHHPALADYIGSDCGIWLMRKDSDIAEQVMLTLHAEGIPSVCIHDSFLVPDHAVDRLVEVMKEVFKDKMGINPGVEVKSP